MWGTMPPQMEGNVGKIVFSDAVAGPSLSSATSSDAAALGLEIAAKTAAYNDELERLRPWIDALMMTQGEENQELKDGKNSSSLPVATRVLGDEAPMHGTDDSDDDDMSTASPLARAMQRLARKIEDGNASSSSLSSCPSFRGNGSGAREEEDKTKDALQSLAEAMDLSRLGKITALLFAPASTSFLPSAAQGTSVAPAPLPSHVARLVARLGSGTKAAMCARDEIFSPDIKAACLVFAQMGCKRPGNAERLGVAAHLVRQGHMSEAELGPGAMRLCAHALLVALEDAAVATSSSSSKTDAKAVGADIELVFTHLCSRLSGASAIDTIIPFFRRLLTRSIVDDELSPMDEEGEEEDGSDDDTASFVNNDDGMTSSGIAHGNGVTRENAEKDGTEHTKADGEDVDEHAKDKPARPNALRQQYILPSFFRTEAHVYLRRSIGLDTYARSVTPLLMDCLRVSAHDAPALVQASVSRVVDVAANVAPTVTLVHVLCPAFNSVAFASDAFVQSIALLISKLPPSSELHVMGIFMRLLSSVGQRAIDALTASATSELSGGAMKLCQMLRPFLRCARCMINVGGGVARLLREQLLRSEVSTVLISSLLSPNAPAQLREASAKCILAVCRVSRADDTAVMNDAMALFAPFFAKCAEPYCSDDDLNLLVVSYPDLASIYGRDMVRLVTPDWQVLEAYIDSTSSSAASAASAAASATTMEGANTNEMGSERANGQKPSSNTRARLLSPVSSPTATPTRKTTGGTRGNAMPASPLASVSSPLQRTFAATTLSSTPVPAAASRSRVSLDGSSFARYLSPHDSPRSSQSGSVNRTRGVTLTPEAIHDAWSADNTSPRARGGNADTSPGDDAPQLMADDEDISEEGYDVVRRGHALGSFDGGIIGSSGGFGGAGMIPSHMADWSWFSPTPYVDTLDEAAAFERIERDFESPDVVPWMMDAAVLRSMRAHSQMRPVKSVAVLDGESSVVSASGRVARVTKLANGGIVTEYANHYAALVGVVPLLGGMAASCDVGGGLRIWNSVSGVSAGECSLLSQSSGRVSRLGADLAPNTIEDIESNDRMMTPLSSSSSSSQSSLYSSNGGNNGDYIVGAGMIGTPVASPAVRMQQTGADLQQLNGATGVGGSSGVSPISVPAGLIPASSLPSCTAFALSRAGGVGASGSGERLVAGTADGRIKLIDAETLRTVNSISGWRCVPFRGQASEAPGLRVQTIFAGDFGLGDRYGSPLGSDCLVMGMSSGYISVLDSRGGRAVSMIRAHDSNNGVGATSLAAGPTPGQLVSGGADKKLVLWDLRMASSSMSQSASTLDGPPPARVATWRGHKEVPQCIVVHGSSIISFGGSRMGVCSAADLDATQQQIAPVRIRSSKGGKERGFITAAALLPCSRALACGTDDGFVRIIR